MLRDVVWPVGRDSCAILPLSLSRPQETVAFGARVVDTQR